jgi:hypothetical protein
MSYHDQIMNLSCGDINHYNSFQERICYKTGHKEARHAAAELALKADTKIEMLTKALDDMTQHYISLIQSGDAGNWDPMQEAEVIQAMNALKAIKE